MTSPALPPETPAGLPRLSAADAAAVAVNDAVRFKAAVANAPLMQVLALEGGVATCVWDDAAGRPVACKFPAAALYRVRRHQMVINGQEVWYESLWPEGWRQVSKTESPHDVPAPPPPPYFPPLPPEALMPPEHPENRFGDDLADGRPH